ncbi:CocE/NonD family hydrolase [Nocardia terpenica]|uniref:CocE/NonD family hydrolase n=1 Tax=Nocardia terpenica TaxID=455432 RepID=UPI0018939436|nr:CocE/NonD family hydrolase [Nocardia terpenica]MBF6059369.1 CocE/NonD family hydrolase [Nocardia terpenica]MBF6103092.1 CocE/NonD family hydrolase [Nocardia terpenica]MBF6110719.1 CocE/NonD family hydrolase [Nocardia terpenica]MBF6116850.1 CocE/NonD family hydrolase [Nocardia terpenica]
MFGRRRIRVRTAVAICALVAALAAPAAQAVPDAGALGAAWTATQDGPPRYPGVHIDWDVPITMSDGTVLKANVYRPADAAGPVREPLPVIVNLMPYTKLLSNLADSALSVPVLGDALMGFLRGFDLSGLGLGGLTDITRALPAGLARTFTVDRKLIRSGYVQVVVDVRGTGFSQGDWQVFGEREQRDGAEVVDWAARQPFSDGSVGMSGVSYSAINQLQTAERHPAGLKALFPVVPGNDLLRDIAATGGGLGVGFLPPWLAGVDGLKLIPDVRSLLTGTFDTRWLADRLADPLTFVDYLVAALTIPSVDAIPDSLRALIRDDSAIRTSWLGHPERITVPTFISGGWHDLFAYDQTAIYRAIPLPTSEKKIVMGDTYHISEGSGFGAPGAPPRLDVLQRAWFDRWLKGIHNGIDSYDPVTMFQQGGGWTGSPSFPRPGMNYRRLYFDPAPSGTVAVSAHDGTLASTPGAAARLTVAPGLATVCSRDAATGTAGALGAMDLCGKDSRVAEVSALTFTSAPAAVATQISGPIAVHLETVLDATDGYWAATLNDVAPDGRSTVWTSGQLQASLRAVDAAKATRSPNGDYTDPYPILTLDSRQPIVPGETTTVDLGLAPTDGILQPGHRLRIDIYALNFPRGLPLRPLLNESGLRPQHLALDPARPSWVNLPLSGTTP